MRVDVWGQILTLEMATAPWLATLKRWTGRTDPSQIEGVEDTIAAINAAEIDISLLSAWYVRPAR